MLDIVDEVTYYDNRGTTNRWKAVLKERKEFREQCKRQLEGCTLEDLIRIDYLTDEHGVICTITAYFGKEALEPSNLLILRDEMDKKYEVLNKIKNRRI